MFSLEKLSASDKFYLGKICPHGHDHDGKGGTYRHRSNATCVTCQRQRIDAWVKSPAGKASYKRSKARHRNKIVADSKEYRQRNYARIIKYNREYRERRKDWRLAYYRDWSSRRNAAKFRAIPVWANSKAIRALHAHAAHLTAETGIPHEVDHIVPLQNKLVCGLHVETNLQVITETENCRKGNRWWPDMP